MTFGSSSSLTAYPHKKKQKEKLRRKSSRREKRKRTNERASERVRSERQIIRDGIKCIEERKEMEIGRSDTISTTMISFILRILFLSPSLFN